MSLAQVLLLVLIGLLAGFASGILGIGGAVIMLPGLTLLLGMSQHDAQGTTLAMMLAPIGILAVMNYWKAGHVNWRYALILMAFFVVGSYFGALLAEDVPDKLLRRIFGVLLLVVAGKMIFGK